MRTIEEKLKQDTVIISNNASKEIIDYLYHLSDEVVITFYRCAMSILACRMMKEDDIEVDMDNIEEWLAYHRKVIGCSIESLDRE